MFKHILVPLDGSHLAEDALPVAISLANSLHASVTLLHVIEQDAPKEVHHDHHLTTSSEARDYLQELIKQLFPPKIKVNIHVHTVGVKNVAAGITKHSVGEYQPDLIILTSHGNSGVRDLIVGNIAQTVAAASRVPVLLLKPGRKNGPFLLRRILVPLDNESIHDAVLPSVKYLAHACSAQLDLLCVIPTRNTDSGAHAAAGNLLPNTAAAYLDMAEEIAREHFEGHLDEFSALGLAATAEIARGDPAAVILRTATRINTDLIIFGTHGRSGLQAFWKGSIAASVARRTEIPLLLIPA